MSRMNGRGATPVGEIDGLPPVELATVVCLRLWCDGTEARDGLRREAARSLGPGFGPEWTEALGNFLDVMLHFGRRPILRHAIGCRCLGADESAVATMVAAATAGEREDAMLIGMLLVRPDMAPSLASLAETVGLGLKRMSVPAPRAPAGASGATLHPAHPTRH